jgi:hypothetical protein
MTRGPHVFLQFFASIPQVVARMVSRIVCANANLRHSAGAIVEGELRFGNSLHDGEIRAVRLILSTASPGRWGRFPNAGTTLTVMEDSADTGVAKRLKSRTNISSVAPRSPVKSG